MTERKHLKRRVRERAAKTGESYTAALWQLRRSEEIITMTATKPQGLTLHCSFCRKSSDHVEKLVAGPGVFICDECIDLAATIVDGERQKSHDEPRVALDERPVDELLALFEGLAQSARAQREAMSEWAAALSARGVTDEQLASVSGMTADELRE